MTDEAMRAAAEAAGLALMKPAKPYEGKLDPAQAAMPVARAAVVAFLKAWEPSEEAMRAFHDYLFNGDGKPVFEECMKAAARAEAERMERGG